jgi:hypothetical protein
MGLCGRELRLSAATVPTSSPIALPDFPRTDAMDHDPDRDPLLDDDETLDFLLYREMERESARPPRSGCLGVMLLLLLPPATLVLLDLLR